MFQTLIGTLSEMPRMWKRYLLVGFDFAVLLACAWLAFHFQRPSGYPLTQIEWLTIGLAPVVSLPIFLHFGFYRVIIRYLPDRALWTLLKATALAGYFWTILFLLLTDWGGKFVPLSIPISYWALTTLTLAASRYATKWLFWYPASKYYPRGQVLVYGAGEAGLQLAAALKIEHSAYIAGFIDDDRSLQGTDIDGIRVYGPERLGELIENFGIREILVSIPSLTAEERKHLLSRLSLFPVQTRILPPLGDVVSGKYLVARLRTIDINDLLERSSIIADPQLLEDAIKDKAILITGAGGYIGAELARLIARWGPRKLVLLEHNEFALYEIERALAAMGTFDVRAILGSITDDRLVRAIFAEEALDCVYHAAAYKHVPIVEANVAVSVQNNVIGSAVLTRAALDAGVPRFVLISSDKAVHPANVMGATKRWAELIARHFGTQPQALERGQRFSVVRFGNVLGSRGSVVPLFQEQISQGGPVTLTDERMTRYFMSTHEAVELIVQAGALSSSGDICLLDMGEPVRIRSLAEKMIHLAGLSVRSPQNPEGDIEITAIGIRPGEKLEEDLFYNPESVEPTAHPKIYRGQRSGAPKRDVQAGLKQLEAALDAADETTIRQLLFDFIAD